MPATPLAERITERSAAGAYSLDQTPARQQAEMGLAEQMGQYGALFSRTLASGFHAASIGARQVPDGNYYLVDPTRSGKYLRIDAR
jgi:hypothetical protein